jgi:predicted enzyme related to lactoylglutathione lyase
MPQMSDNTEKVTGIGGIFFRVRDPQRMSAWYREHLGICAKDGHADFVWREHERPNEIGRTVWSVFPADTDYFGPSRPAFMINYRVSNLDQMLAKLRLGGITVDKVEDYDYGRFAWITDPEGNRIELWEPKGK